MAVGRGSLFKYAFGHPRVCLSGHRNNGWDYYVSGISWRVATAVKMPRVAGSKYHVCVSLAWLSSLALLGQRNSVGQWFIVSSAHGLLVCRNLILDSLAQYFGVGQVKAPTIGGAAKMAGACCDPSASEPLGEGLLVFENAMTAQNGQYQEDGFTRGQI